MLKTCGAEDPHSYYLSVALFKRAANKCSYPHITAQSWEALAHQRPPNVSGPGEI